MKFLITGASGQLGYDVKLELLNRGYYDILSPSSSVMDLRNKDSVRDTILDYKPDVVFHCAAYTAVDKAEDERELCSDVNINGTKYIVDACSEVGAKLIFISTDYVFDGSKDGFYLEDDKVSPINYYGKTKWLAEENVRGYDNHIITRISWVFGINGNNFVKTMLRLSDTRDEISVVSDQIGSPTYTKDLSKVLVDMALSDKKGTYHVTNDGTCSWYEFAKYIFESNNIDIVVNPIKTSDYPTKAKRPHNSRMSKEKLVNDGFSMLPDWKDAVDRYNKELIKVRKKDD